jgi:hypothetical protein
LDFVKPLTDYNEAEIPDFSEARASVRQADGAAWLLLCSRSPPPIPASRESSKQPCPAGPAAPGMISKAVPRRRATPRMAGEPLRLRNLDDGAGPTDRRPRRFLCLHNIGETDTIILGPDCVEPMPHIAPEHERI